MTLVIDASVSLAWCFPDESDGYADAVLTALERESALLPAVWPLEVSNGLLMGLRRGIIGQSEVAGAERILGDLDAALISPEIPESLGPILSVASEHGLTAHDASYLHLALRESAALATLDDRLRAAARAAGCRVFEPA